MKSTNALFLLFLLSSPAVHGQAVSNPNQIVGSVELTNAHPDILAILEDLELERLSLSATSVGMQPTLSASTRIETGTPTGTAYEITVEAGPAGAGIRYDVSAELRLEAGGVERYRYHFAAVTSEPVEAEPAPDVGVDLRECAGLVHLRWVTPAGAPAAVDWGATQISPETSPGSGVFGVPQATSGPVPAGAEEDFVPVRGDGTLYNVRVFLQFGTDRFDDLFRTWSLYNPVQVHCDEIVEVVVEVPDLQTGLGAIVGVVDILGEEENRLFDPGEGAAERTLMVADHGHFDNYRYAAVGSATPSEGLFELPNLVPSDLRSPPRDYAVSGRLNLRLGRRNEVFYTPDLSGSNGRVAVPAGETVDLGDTFVMAPGFVGGEIFLAGPAVEDVGSCLEDVVLADDQDGDGIPDIDVSAGYVSRLEAVGVDSLTAGATKTALGGHAWVLFDGEHHPGPQGGAFEGDYELVLGGLLQEPTLWRAPAAFRLWLSDRRTPGIARSMQHSFLDIAEPEAPPLEIVPGATLDVPIRRCFGQLNLQFLSTSGALFYPQVSGSGSFSGIDFEGNPADYAVNQLWAQGTPGGEAQAAEEGLVVACLPQGQYTLNPSIRSVNPGGGWSSTQLPPVAVEIGCREIKDVVVGLNRPPVADAGADAAVECAGAGGTPVVLDGSGSSDPDDDPLSYAWTWAAGGPADGVQPTVALPLGTHLVTLTVDDGHGESDDDQVEKTVVDTTPPVIGSAAADPSVLWPPNHRMRAVAVEVANTDLCEAAPADCRITDVASNEPVDGPGDGDTAPDWEITGDLTIDLRAERAGGGDGRIYTLELACEDASGNTSTTTTAVTVPHDRHGR